MRNALRHWRSDSTLLLTLPLLMFGTVAAAPAAQAAVTPQATVTITASVTVPGDAASGVLAVSGAEGTVSVTATGNVYYGYEGGAGCVGNPYTTPNGNRYLKGVQCTDKYGAADLLPSAPVGELLANTNGTWFAVGASDSFSAGSGTVYLAYNDSIYTDNTGSYTASVTYTRIVCPTCCSDSATAAHGVTPAVCCSDSAGVLAADQRITVKPSAEPAITCPQTTVKR